ncbi:MAG: hypothetical protein IRZ28_18050 [Steroidobacteraceae bacterium]|nr:hypothetical protein [Steroidobacteraceae bacterium]
MSTSTLVHEDANRMHHWLALSPEQQADAIRRLAALGWTDHGIASATRLAVEQVRRLLGSTTKCPRTGIPAQFCTCAGPHEVSA